MSGEVPLSSDDPSDRLAAVDSLHGRPRRHAVPTLLAALSDPDDDVSGEAARRLGGLATATVVPPLVREYVRPDRFPGTYAYDVPYFAAIEGLGSDGAWKPLVDALEAATERETVSRCVLLLERLHDVRARPALERVLADVRPEVDAESDDVRARTARGAKTVLDRLDEVAARTVALRTLDDVRRALDADEYRDRETGQLGLRQWVRTADSGALVDAPGDRRNAVAGEAAAALGVRGAAEAVPGLVREVAREERSLAAAVAAYQFAGAGDLEHSNHARALVRIDDRAAVEPLLDALDRGGDGWVTWEIGWVLGLLGDPRALAAVEGKAPGGRPRGGWRSRAYASTLNTAAERLRFAAEREGEPSR